MALGFNFESEPGNFTKFGRLERYAKRNRCPEAVKSIAEKMVKVIKQFEPLKNATAICAVPKHEGKDFHLPEKLAELVAMSLAKPDITPCFTFGADKPSLTGLNVNEKWDRLATCNFEAKTTEIPVKNEKIILIDDKYQSGITIHFVASKLLELGASEIYGLCAVKTWSDDDNMNK
jgi:predicted amidophosphoribosyltransferase